MHHLLLLAASTKSTSGGSALGFLLPILIIGAVFVLMIRPQRARAKAAQQMQAQLGVGSDVVTAGGVHGTVTMIDESDGTVTLSISPGVEVRFDRRSVARVVTGAVTPPVELPSEERPTA